MNIFARELAAILKEHEKTLENLYRLHIPDPYQGKRLISQNKVTRLRKSLTENMTATLSSEELEQVQYWVPLDPEGREMRRLKAALVAEAVRALMEGRTDPRTAGQIGEMTLHLLTSADNEELHTIPAQLLNQVRYGSPPTQPAPPLEIEEALEPATETYEQGLLWIEIARETLERGAQQGYAAQAKMLLTRARSLATNTQQVAHSSPQQAELLMAIESALTEADCFL